MRTLQDYTDVKMTIAETELFAIHQKELMDRPGAFGLPFLSGTLAGCLFNAVEYVQAQRVRRQIVLEMEPLYKRYDVLLTVSSAPAPRFDRISPSGRGSARIYTPRSMSRVVLRWWSVTATPRAGCRCHAACRSAVR